MGKTIEELTERERLDECFRILDEVGILKGKPNVPPETKSTDPPDLQGIESE